MNNNNININRQVKERNDYRRFYLHQKQRTIIGGWNIRTKIKWMNMYRNEQIELSPVHVLFNFRSTRIFVVDVCWMMNEHWSDAFEYLDTNEMMSMIWWKPS